MPSQKETAQRQALKAINRQSQIRSMPIQVPALIALLPTYIFYRFTHTHLNKGTEVVFGLVIFLTVQLLAGLYLRAWLRKHPALKWQILIR